MHLPDHVHRTSAIVIFNTLMQLEMFTQLG